MGLATLMRWIQVLYNHPKTAVQTNGLISEYFALGRETGQGLAIEILAAAIRAEPNFMGVTVGRVVHKCLLYADEILFVSEPAT